MTQLMLLIGGLAISGLIVLGLYALVQNLKWKRPRK